MIIGEDSIVCSLQSGPTGFEFQSDESRPSLARTRGLKPNSTKQKRKSMALPQMISNSDPRTPLVQKSVRRSTRLSIGNEGYRSVRITGNPSKKPKNWIIQIDETTGEAGPVSIDVLQGWGINCGVDPVDLTEDALLQAPDAPMDIGLYLSPFVDQ